MYTAKPHFMLKETTLINRITHKDLQILYGLSRTGALRRLNIIRASLNKKKHHVLTVLDFCKAEDISLADFDNLMKRAEKK